MDIQLITTGKKQFLPLLLLADEQEDMIDRYLDRGDLFAMRCGGDVCCVAVITDEGDGVWELKNLAVRPADQRKGYGRKMVLHMEAVCRQRGGRLLQVGTGDSTLTLPFYQACGFRISHRVPEFFTRHYDHPIIEAGVQLRDMIYLCKPLV